VNLGDEVKLLILRRVYENRVTRLDGFYFDDGQRIWHFATGEALGALAETSRARLLYPPGSGALRQQDYGPGELVAGVHFGLTVAERTRRVVLTERGLAEYEALHQWTYLWQPAARAAGLPPRTGLHALRHLYASLLIRHGESVKTVQKRLGHSSAAVTLDTYAHLWPDADDRTRDAVQVALAAKIDGPADSVRTDRRSS
jgi:integrase